MLKIFKNKGINRYLAIILIFAFCFSSIGLPIAYASEVAKLTPDTMSVRDSSNTVNTAKDYGDVTIAPPSDLPAKAGKNRVEIPSRRNANSKLFLETNGTFTQEIYPESIFYQNGKKQWLPIESKLVNANDAAFKVKNKANSFNLNLGDNAKMRFEDKDMFIELEPKGAKPSQGTVNENKIKYAKIFPEVDIEYTSKNDEIKEDIILLTPEASNTFTFNVKTRNLEIKEDPKTGILNLYDNKGSLVAYFMKPFMVDANNEISDKVTLEYKKIDGQEQLTVTADSEWLQDSNRTYPVKVDPTIIKADPEHLYKDTFVSELYPSSQYSATNFLYSGYTSTYGKTRSFVQNILPDLPSSAKVTGGSIGLYQRLSNSQTIVDVHQNTSNWSASGTTWNNQPSFSATAEASITGTAIGYWDFNITNLLKKWYNADAPNYGVTVKHRTETSQYKEFESVNYMYNMPKITVNYEVDPIGYEDQWGFTPEGVNGFNGNLIDQVTDLDVPGRGIPVSLTRSYNSRSDKEGILGYGWRTNLELSIKDSGYGPVVYTDEDGTEHIFNFQKDWSFKAPTGVFLKLVKDEVTGKYTIARTDGVTLYFTTAGKLEKITDTNKTPNTTTYGYDANGRLSTITDASGRITNLYYNTNGKLSKITDPAGKSVQYGYNTAGNLTTITNQEAKVTTYGYDVNHNLTSITDPNGNTVTYGYDSVNDRVNSVSRTITVNGTPTTSATNISYDTFNRTTTRTDAKGVATKYIYDQEGKILEVIQDPSGLNYSTKFSYDVDNNINQIIDPKNGTYKADFELGTGNLITETDSFNEPHHYDYDSRNNLTQEIDREDRVTNKSYDSSNNNTENTDPITQTSASRYMANGNLDYTTTLISAGENLISNSSMERDTNGDGLLDDWKQQQQSGATVDSFWSTLSKYGQRSIGIGNTTGWAVIKNGVSTVQHEPGKSYVLSGYVQTTNLSSKAAYIGVYFFDANNVNIGSLDSVKIGGTTDWTRVQVIIDAPFIPAGTTKIQAAVTRLAATGYSRFDAIQLEESKVQSGYNLVENASFELDANADKLPDQWTKSFTFGTGEGIDTTFKHAGKASFKMVGQAGVNKYIKQRLNVKGNQNNKYTLSGWSYADNPDPNGGYYALQVAINYDDGTTDWSYSNDFTRENHAEMGWEHVVAEIKPTKAFSSMDVYYYFYNQTGNAWFDIMRLEEGNKIIDYGYDANGNFVTSVKDPVNNTTNFEYDGSGNRTKVIDPKTKATSFSYDQMNRLTKVTDALLGETIYGYDNNGNRTTVKDAKNNTTTYGYNEINQVKSIVDPLNKTTTIDYDLLGDQTAINYPNGNKVGFGYDKLNRVTSILFNGQNKYSFGYDQKGNRTSVTDVAKSQTTQYSYDADDKLKNVTEPNGNSIEYGYDKTGNLEYIAPKINGIIYSTAYDYNALEQLYAVSWGSLYKYFGYDENGNITGSFNANKTQAQLNYDDAGKVKNIKNQKDNGTKIGDYGYSYDANGNITRVTLESDTLGSKTISYTYDDLNRLAKETLRDGTIIDYQYDAVGNRTQRVITKPDGTILTGNYTYDAANQLLSVNSNDGYTWDNGNMTSDGSKNFEYDANNRLVKVTNKATGAVIATYEYDADGRRTSKTTSTGSIKYFYDGGSTRVLYETDGNNALLARYIYDQNEQLVAMSRGGQSYFYHYNAHGDVVALTDLNGNVVAEYDYDAYGQPVTTGLEGTVENSYRYAGYRWDSETGMYYLNARYYWPAVGRFITRDAFHGFEDEPASLNQYNYAHSNPVMYVDPSGHHSVYKNGKAISHYHTWFGWESYPIWTTGWITTVYGCHGSNKQRRNGIKYVGISKSYVAGTSLGASILFPLLSVVQKAQRIHWMLVGAGVMGASATFIQDYAGYYEYRNNVTGFRNV